MELVAPFRLHLSLEWVQESSKYINKLDYDQNDRENLSWNIRISTFEYELLNEVNSVKNANQLGEDQQKVEVRVIRISASFSVENQRRKNNENINEGMGVKKEAKTISRET